MTIVFLYVYTEIHLILIPAVEQETGYFFWHAPLICAHLPNEYVVATHDVVLLHIYIFLGPPLSTKHVLGKC